MSSDDLTPGPPNQPGQGQPDPGAPQNPPLRARVPDSVAGGTFSTGAIVMTGPSEFIVDFLQTIGRPHKVAARVVIPHQVMPQFIDALNTNLEAVDEICRQLRLRVALPKGDARMQAAVMLTVHTMNSMKAGRHEIPV